MAPSFAAERAAALAYCLGYHCDPLIHSEERIQLHLPIGKVHLGIVTHQRKPAPSAGD